RPLAAAPRRAQGPAIIHHRARPPRGRARPLAALTRAVRQPLILVRPVRARRPARLRRGPTRRLRPARRRRPGLLRRAGAPAMVTAHAGPPEIRVTPAGVSRGT